MFAVVDIETTGSHTKSGRITEIAVCVTNGSEIIEKYETLVNPEQGISSFIVGLTGISQDMVRTAPLFSDIADELYSILEENIFVAHNVNFDYGFIKSEFQRIGIDYSAKKLCTVRLSRRIIPGHNSYSLGKLCKDLGISIAARHRAMGDADATAHLFNLLVAKDEEGFISKALKKNSK